MHDYSSKLFAELSAHLSAHAYKSVLHGNAALSELGMANYVMSYMNVFDSLLRRFIDELKQFNEGSFLLVLEQAEHSDQGKLTIDKTDFNCGTPVNVTCSLS